MESGDACENDVVLNLGDIFNLFLRIATYKL